MENFHESIDKHKGYCKTWREIMKSLKAGFAREIITPPRGLELAGYFNPRPNRGALDDLCVKAVLFRDGKKIGGIVSFDLCFVSLEMTERLINDLKKRKHAFANNLLICATHTHTGPYVSSLFNATADTAYLKHVNERAIQAVERALANLHPVTLHTVSVNDNPHAFNRRYYMKDGGVLTNPGKLNPDIVKPEGPVDNEIGIIAVKDDDRLECLITNLSNHTDTVGGDLVSADWPGRMEAELQAKLGCDVPVVTLIAPSGNINHFDVKSAHDQTCYKEACIIGKGYAKVIYDALGGLKPVKDTSLAVSTRKLTIPYRKFTKAELDAARQTIENSSFTVDHDLTSEDLAKGTEAVTFFFADQMLKYAKVCSGKKRTFTLVALKFGKELALSSLPGEPFTEIGVAIKKGSPFRKTYVVALGMGRSGYTAMPECFDRGGYEILPVVEGGPPPETAHRMIEYSLKNLKS